MTRFVYFVLAVIAIQATSFAEPVSKPAGDAARLTMLRPGHPRLFAFDEDFDRLRDSLKSDENVRRVAVKIREAAVRTLDEPPVEHKLVGPRLLGESRKCLGRVSTLAMAYHLYGDRRFAARAEKEMLTAAAFPDWNPKHFLDTAEMTNALAIGYDWLYDELTPESRATIRNAIVKLGLEPGLKVYRNGEWWAKSHHNWNQVCNGGLTVGALAIADEEPGISAEIINYAKASIPLAMNTLAPDGGWPEGPGYWNYALRYTAYYHAALLTALGTDFGLKDTPGYAETGLFRIHSIGPTKRAFNFADAGEGVGSAAQMFFLGRLFEQPVYAQQERQLGTGADAFELVWYEPQTKAEIQPLPLDAFFRGVDVVFLRSEWNNPDAVYVGFKGGDNAANHSNLDLGTFVIDALGQRWAVELGADDYNIPGYFGNKRWTYYRLRTEGQNTLVLNGDNQDPKAKAPIIKFESSPQRAFAVADLSAGYKKHAQRVCRGVALLDRKHVLIQDEIESDRPVDVAWGMHVACDAKADGRRVVLTQKGQTMHVQLIEPADATFMVTPVSIEPPQRPAKGISKLSIQMKTAAGSTGRIRVLITPDKDAIAAPKLMPETLEQWPK